MNEAYALFLAFPPPTYQPAIFYPKTRVSPIFNTHFVYGCLCTAYISPFVQLTVYYLDNVIKNRRKRYIFFVQQLSTTVDHVVLYVFDKSNVFFSVCVVGRARFNEN